MVSIVATFKDVNFTRSRNDAGAAGGAIKGRLWSNLEITFKKVRFVENTARYSGSAIALSQSLTSEASGHLILQKFVFTGNYGYYGAIYAQGRYNISCQNYTFSSHYADFLSGGLSLQLTNSILRISNSIFVNNTNWYNSGGAIGIYNTIITDSIFIKKTAFNGTGGAISILASTDEIKKKRCYHPFRPSSWNYLNSVEFHRTRFQGNIAKNGNALYITNGLVTLRDLIIDNFGFASGSQIVTYGSAKVKIYNSIFRETIEKMSVNGNEFVFSSFFGIYSNGPLEVYNSTVDQAIPSNEHLIMVSKMGRLEFDNSSVITCPLGYRLIKSDYSYMRNDLDGCTVSVTVIRLLGTFS